MTVFFLLYEFMINNLHIFCRHSSIFLTEEEKDGDAAMEDDELPPLPDKIESYQVKMEDKLPPLPDKIESYQVHPIYQVIIDDKKKSKKCYANSSPFTQGLTMATVSLFLAILPLF